MNSAPNKTRVLVVDDLQDTATSLSLLLQMAGHETKIALDGHSALEVYSEFGPDAVLLDIGLLDWTGTKSAGESGLCLTARQC